MDHFVFMYGLSLLCSYECMNLVTVKYQNNGVYFSKDEFHLGWELRVKVPHVHRNDKLFMQQLMM